MTTKMRLSMDSSIKAFRLLKLYENYNVVKSEVNDISIIDFMYYVKLEHDKKNKDKCKDIAYIDLMTVHDDREERLPLFCMYLDDGEMVTCYEKEVYKCECGNKLKECSECLGLICSKCNIHTEEE